LREGWRVASKGGVIDLLDEDTEKGGGLIVGVRQEVGVDLDDECGGDGGEQTSL